MEIIKYPDNTSYIKVKEYKNEVVFKLNNYEDLWYLNQFVDASYNFCNTKPTIIIPNLLDAQADRRFGIGESSGLKLICKFLNSLNANFKIFHPHNAEVVEALIDNVEIIDNSNFIKEVLTSLPSTDNLILMSSDAGGFKPLIKLCDKINWQGETMSASKSRLWDGKESRLVQQIQCEDFEGKDILIIDDILVGGKTFLGIAELLQNKNIGNLYLAVSHITISNPNGDLDKYYKKIFTTNSKNLSYNLKNIEVINIF